MDIKNELFKHQDLKYRDFSANIINNIDRKRIIGVRNPICKDIARKAFNEGKYQKFLDTLPHKYQEECMVHGYIINLIKDYDMCIKELDKYLPYVDNWSTCDTINPKIFNKHKDILIKDIKRWLKSKHTYEVRFAVGCLMGFYLGEDFKEEHLKLVKGIKSKEYYINMMRAWYFATALAKNRNQTMKLIESKTLDEFTHNKTIQKAIESYRISDKDKKYLRTLKIQHD